MRKRIILLSLFLFNFSCFSQFATDEMKAVFTQQEIADLKILNDFFVESVCQENEIIDFKTCFEKELPYMYEYGFDSIVKRVDFEEQKKIYETISASTFNEIWGYAKKWKDVNQAPTYKWLSVKNYGNYLNFLLEVGKKNEFIFKYGDFLLSAGDLYMTSSFILAILENPDELNLNDPNIQLITSIHMLSILDLVQREELWEDE